MAHKVLDLGAYRLKPQVHQRILREKLRKERQASSSAVGEQEDFVQLLFGKGHLDLRLPKDIDVTVVRKPEMKGVSDPESEVRATLSPLEQSAATATSACILICDITRPVPNGVLLPPIIDILRCAGVSDITILVATGLHRPNLGVELGRLLTQGSDWELGEAMATWLQDVRVENHYARNDEDHVNLGKTSRGTAVKLDKRFVDADLKIVTGLVEPHFMAGWSGGRKVIAPGIAHHETIRTFHSARFMEDPCAKECILEANPLHADQLEILDLLESPVYALNTVLNEDREISFVSYGEIRDSHALAVEFVKPFVEVHISRKFNTVVSSAAGYPLDLTYYQTIKAMVTLLDIVEDGADVIIASEISEGLGSEEFRDAQQRLVQLGHEEFLDTLKAKSHADVDEWQSEMLVRALRKARVKLFSPLMRSRPDDCAVSAVEFVDNLEKAVLESVERSGDKHIAVIPEGPYVIPKYTML